MISCGEIKVYLAKIYNIGSYNAYRCEIYNPGCCVKLHKYHFIIRV